MKKVTWKGEAGAPDVIEQYGISFPRGEAVNVPSDHQHIAKFEGNPHFEVEGGEPDEEVEPAYTAVKKAKGKWLVEGPDGFETLGPMPEAEAHAKAAELNAEAE